MKKVLALDTDIYSERAIICAIKAFSDIAQIKLNTENNQYLCQFVKTKYDVELTKKEFENYVIDLSNQQRMFE